MAGAAPFAELGGRAAIVTGAAQGIGRTAAETLAAHGMAVVVADTNAERGQRVVDGITASGGRAVFAEADVGTRAGCERMVSAAVEHFGGVFALVNNARVGMGHANAPLADILEADWDRSQDVLLKSHFLACKFAIPHMIAGGGGSIVGVSSLHAQQTNDVEGPYASAKAGVQGLMRSVAVAYGKHGIRANSILPGGIMTDVKHEEAALDPTPAPGWTSSGRKASARARAAFLRATRAGSRTTGMRAGCAGGRKGPRRRWSAGRGAS